MLIPHVELTPYPFPEGMAIPRLMPYQEFPCNNDGYLAAEVLRTKNVHGLNCAVETGMCLGSTTSWLSEHFHSTVTCEINEDYARIGNARCGHLPGVRIFIHPSPMVVGLKHPSHDGNRCLYYLDAHWSDHCPLLDELEAIAAAKIKPCIIIHDFQVPGTDFGYDKMPDGRPFCLDLIRHNLDAIYGKGGWKHNYPTKVEGARRGWISIEPNA